MELNSADRAAVRLLEVLATRGWRFVPPTPASHRIVVGRPGRELARDLADVLGWSLPFNSDTVEPELLALLEQARCLAEAPGGLLRSRVRVATLGRRLYLHSAFPTDAPDAVFFGPDSYRFAALIERELAGVAPGSIGAVIDIGTGAGVGALVAADACRPSRVVGSDINPVALRFAAINAAAAGIPLERMEGEGLDGFRGTIDLALANPPYIVDRKAREYRDGGGLHGGEVALEMAQAALAWLAPAGRLILYTGSAIVSGRDELGEQLAALARESGADLRYWELDPDVFGEELAGEAYRDVDRIAVVAAVFTRRG